MLQIYIISTHFEVFLWHTSRVLIIVPALEYLIINNFENFSAFKRWYIRRSIRIMIYISVNHSNITKNLAHVYVGSSCQIPLAQQDEIVKVNLSVEVVTVFTEKIRQPKDNIKMILSHITQSV